MISIEEQKCDKFVLHLNNFLLNGQKCFWLAYDSRQRLEAARERPASQI